MSEPGLPRPVWIELVRPLFCAMVVNCMLMGAITLATASYLRQYGRKDRLFWRAAVGISWVAHVFVTVGFILAVHNMTVSNAADPSFFLTFPLGLKVSNVADLVPLVIAQVFLVERVYKISKSKVVLGVSSVLVLACALAGFGEIVTRVTAHSALSYKMLEIWVPFYLWACVVVDMWLCGSSARYLLRQRQHFNPTTDYVLGRLVKISVECALPPALCAVAGAVAYQCNKTGTTFVFFFCNVPPLYTLGMLYTLNSRETVKADAEKHSAQITSMSMTGKNGSNANNRVSMSRAGVFPITLTRTSVVNIDEDEEFVKKPAQVARLPGAADYNRF